MPRIRSMVGVTLLSLTSLRYKVYFIGFKAVLLLARAGPRLQSVRFPIYVGTLSLIFLEFVG